VGQVKHLPHRCRTPTPGPAMKALELVGPSLFELVDKDVPQPAANEVLIRVKACGICGSDIHGANGSSGRRIPPIVMGHEAAGEIATVGESVSSYAEGDRVTFDSMVYCGDCHYCNLGRTNLCETRQVMGVSCDEFRRHGAYAEYVCVPERIVCPLPEGLSFDHAAFTEPVGVAVHAVNRANVSPGDSAIVVGAGLIGLLVVQALKNAGCSTIIALDLVPQRLDLATKLGATHAMLATQENVVSEIHELTDGRGANHSFEVVGATKPVELAIDGLRRGGTCVLVGNLAAEVTFPLQKVVTRELNVVGTCGINDEVPECVELIASGKINVEPLISARSSLDEAADWFAKLEAGDQPWLKVLVCP
jgi:L-iditol 2-dehydrogenase